MPKLALNAIMQVRRQQPTRLEGFVDASFAFAVTLVVISIGHVPGSMAEMLTVLRGLPTFAICFVLITRIWLAHREWSRHYDLEDNPSVLLSLALVFVVLVYVYPLRLLIAQAFFGWSGGWLSDGSVAVIRTTDELRDAYIVFGLGLATISLVFILLFRHALHAAARIGLSASEVLYTRLEIKRRIGQFIICMASIALAYWLPIFDILTISLPGLVYLAGFAIGYVLRARCRRALAGMPVAKR